MSGLRKLVMDCFYKEDPVVQDLNQIIRTARFGLESLNLLMPEGKDTGKVNSSMPEEKDMGNVCCLKPEERESGNVNLIMPEQTDTGIVNCTVLEEREMAYVETNDIHTQEEFNNAKQAYDTEVKTAQVTNGINTQEELNKAKQAYDTILKTAQAAKIKLSRSRFGQWLQHDPIAVQLLFPNETEVKTDIQNEIKTHLEKWAKYRLYIDILHQKPAIDENKPLFVVCFSLLRLEADINQALSQIRQTGDHQRQNIAVFIIHSGTVSSLPQLPSSRRVGELYQGITLIDIASDNDFQNCEMNETAAIDLNEFLEKCSA